MYLKTEEIEMLDDAPPLGEVRASAVVTFRARSGNEEVVYCSCVMFDPGDRQSLRSAATWLERDYVGERYRGRILTDFDETTRWFRRVQLPLTTVMDVQTDSLDLIDQAASGFVLDQRETARLGPTSIVQTHREQQMLELRLTYDKLTDRIRALDTDINRELDSERKLTFKERRSELDTERAEVFEQMSRLENQVGA